MAAPFEGDCPTQDRWKNQAQDEIQRVDRLQCVVKRAACERCRVRKLRCIRSDEGNSSGTGYRECDRCKAISAECHYGVARRAGRPKTVPKVDTVEELCTEPSQCCALRTSSNQTEMMNNLNVTEANDDCNDGEHVEGLFDTGNLALSWLASTDEQFMPTLDETNQSVVGSSNDLFSASSFSEIIGTALHQNKSDADPFNSGLELFDQEPSIGRTDWSSNSFRSPSTHFQETRPCQGSAYIHNQHDSLQEYARLGAKLPQELLHDASDAQRKGKTNESEMSSSLLNSSSNNVLELDPSPMSSDAHQNTVQLSQLELTLQSVLRSKDTRGSLLNSIGPDDPFIAAVLKCSMDFTNILTFFFEPASQPTLCSLFPPMSRNVSISSGVNGQIGLRGDPSQWQRGDSMSASTTCNFKEPSRIADMPTALKLLLCYLRIVHLHSTLYTKIHKALLEQLQSKKQIIQIPPIFPGMHVGGVFLDGYGKFQVKYLVQILTHLLGEIEVRLGLPKGFRVGQEQIQRKGILQVSLSSEFIEQAIIEHSRKEAIEQTDGLSSLKRSLEEMRELLRSEIEI